MKKITLVLLSLTNSLPFLLLGQTKEYFSVERWDADSGMPRSIYKGYQDGFYNTTPIRVMGAQKWFYGPNATGNWLGLRSALENVGIIPNLSYLGNFAGNLSGGQSRGVAVSSSVHLGFGVDLEKITTSEALRGWSFVNNWAWRFGESITNSRIGNQFNVQQNYGAQTIMLQSVYFSWKGELTEDLDLMVKFGRIAAGDNFLTKPIYWLYQNNAIDGNPVGVFNQTRYSAYPGSTWGALARLGTSNGYFGKIGVYQINSEEQDKPHNHGMDWSFRKADGVNLNLEFGWNLNHDDSGKSPGNISAGAVLDWYSAQHLDDPSKNSHFNPTYYLQADYMIWNMGFPDRSDPTTIRRLNNNDKYRDLRGIILWTAVQYNAEDNLAKIPFFVNGGLLFNAPFESRPDDVLAFGMAYGKYSGKLTTPEKNSYEIMLELNYKVQLNKFLFVQPNMQYIINPKGGQYSDAFVLGCQFGMAF